jgi:hypothetical protein
MSRQTRAVTVVSHPLQVLDAAAVGTAEPQPRLLNGVVRLGARAQHPVGDRPQMGPVRLKAFGQKFILVHRSHSLAALRHTHDERGPADVTDRIGPGDVKRKSGCPASGFRTNTSDGD